MPADRDLVIRIRTRDVHAFGILLERYEALIRRHLVRIVQDDAAAQDLIQEAFLRVWTRSEQWTGSGSFKAWLYRIATNLAFNHLRSVRRRREQPLEIGDDWGEDENERHVPAWMIDDSTLGPDQAQEITERCETLLRLMERLPEEKREVIRLVHEMEMSMRDVADELGIPEGTVKSRLYYAKKHLTREWKDQEA